MASGSQRGSQQVETGMDDSAQRPEHSPYSQVCWERFRRPRHAGPPPQADGMAMGTARGRSEDTEVLFWLSSAPAGAWFQVHGSPWAIAAADLVCEHWLAGRTVPDAHVLQSLLTAPPDRLDAFFTVEDAWASAQAALDHRVREVR